MSMFRLEMDTDDVEMVRLMGLALTAHAQGGNLLEVQVARNAREIAGYAAEDKAMEIETDRLEIENAKAEAAQNAEDAKDAEEQSDDDSIPF